MSLLYPTKSWPRDWRIYFVFTLHFMAVLENVLFRPWRYALLKFFQIRTQPQRCIPQKRLFCSQNDRSTYLILVRSSGSPQNTTNHKQSPIFPRSANRHDRRSFISIWPGSSPPTYGGENELLARPSTIPTIFTTGSEFSLSLDWSLVTPTERPTYFLVAFFLFFFFWLWRTGHIWWLFVKALKILVM